MSRPDTTYDIPAFELLPDPQGARMFANISNQVQRHYTNGKVKYVPVVVSAMLFTLMRDVFKIAPEDQVTLYLMPDAGYFVFGLTWGDSADGVADLWAYTDATLPHCLR